MTQVYIIEHRTNGADECTVAHISSTLEKAVDWMKENTDYEDPKKHWWWAVYPCVVDAKDFWEEVPENSLKFFTKDVVEVEDQPIDPPEET